MCAERNDYMYSAVAAEGFVRIIGAETSGLTEEARKIHNTTPVATAALGRVLTAAAMLSRTLKNEEDSMTIQFKGNGPLGLVVTVTDSHANVRGYVGNPACDLPLNSKGKLDVGGAIGKGYLNIIKDMGLKEPYSGTIPLVSGEVAEDISCYLAVSEQVPSVVSLGVLVGPGNDGENHVICSGGFILQLMPGAPESMISDLENRVNGLASVTKLLSGGKGIRDIIKDLLEGYAITNETETSCGYCCSCSREKMAKALISLGPGEIRDIIETQGRAELTCQFCRTCHTFEKEELEALLEDL